MSTSNLTCGEGIKNNNNNNKIQNQKYKKKQRIPGSILQTLNKTKTKEKKIEHQKSET